MDEPAGDALARLGLRVDPMTADSSEALVRFHEALTPSTVRNRFFRVHPHLSAAEVATFTQVDHHDREALVVWHGPEIVAIARFDRFGRDGTTAEVAFVVADSWQHQGIATSLLLRLIFRARELGVERFVADTLASNLPMRAVFRHAGYPHREEFEAGVVRVVLELRPLG